MNVKIHGLIYLLALLLLSGPVLACLDIDPIQEYDPTTGYPLSPYHGMIVDVKGTVYVENHIFDRQTLYIQDATGGIILELPEIVDEFLLGELIHVWGTVGMNSRREIVLKDISLETREVGTVPAPATVNIADLVTPSDYEQVGMFTTCLGTVTETGASYFFLEEAGGDRVRVFIDESTGIDIGNVNLGDEYRVTGVCAVRLGEIQLMPRIQEDMLENPLGDPPPVITDPEVYYYAPTPTDPITIAANVTDNYPEFGVTLYYREATGDTVSTDPFLPLTMLLTTGTTYEATIPAPHTLDQIDYYIEADDDINPPTTYPGGAPLVFLSLAVGFTTIYDTQYVDPTEQDQDSPLLYQDVSIYGVVTFSTYAKDALTSPVFVVQQFDPQPSDPNNADSPITYDARWKGIVVEQVSASKAALSVGNLVQISGTIHEEDGLTIIKPYNDDAITTEGVSNETPDPIIVPIHMLSDSNSDEDGISFGEAYEGVFVRSRAGYVVPLPFQESMFYLQDFVPDEIGKSPEGEASLLVIPREDLNFVPIEGDHTIVQGFMGTFYGEFAIVPVTLDDIHSGITAVDDEQPARRTIPSLRITPNPFNPKTVVSFRVERPSRVVLEIYDIKGRLMRTLHDGVLEAREHAIAWQGTDRADRQVASGVYFAKLRIGTEIPQVKELTLVR